MFNITELTCRVCLQEQSILINIYDELEDLNTNLRNLLETYADLQIKENDIFPKYLCEDCTRELLIASKFREKCNRSREILYDILENSKENAVEDVIPTDDVIIECSVEELDFEQVSDLLITEESSIELVNENQLNIEEAKVSLVQQDFSMSLLKRNDTDSLNEEMTTNTEDQLQPVDIDSLIVEDISNQCEQPTEMEIPLEDRVIETPKDFTNNASLLKPLVEKWKKSYLTYKCDICGATFKQAFNLQKHLRKNHDPMHYFTCAKCDHWFTKDAEFLKHMQYCDCTTNNKDNNEEHKKLKADKLFRHKLEQETNHKCIYCEKEFPTPFALRMHIRTHTGERPFQCKFCIKSFKTQSQLNVHHKRHTGQADFTCSICHKAFCEQSNLIVHMRSHTGERPHICTVCSKSFTRVSLLEFHMRIHTGEKPYSCTYCDKSFRQATDLRSHLMIHTGQKQHVCVICRKSYIKRSHLVKHMRKHNISSGDMMEIAQYEHTESSEQISQATAIDNIQNFVENSEILNGFDEIIEKDDVELQADEFS